MPSHCRAILKAIVLAGCCFAFTAQAALAWEEPAENPAIGSYRPILQLPVEPFAPLDTASTLMQPDTMQPSGSPPASAPPAGPALDAGMIAAGEGAFNRACTSCHDAERSLQKSKSYSGWLATVQRMASKEGADISSADVAPIAVYLSSVAGSGAAGGEGGDDGSGWSFGTTVSTLHRSASDAFPLENPGFFADVWVTASYQSSGPLRGTVTACTSCHSRDNGASGFAYSLELVEGSATLDLRQLCHGCRCDDGYEMLLKGGRFIVPFGAFAGMSHPGTYRTVTQPLMFNMGRRVFYPGALLNQPVLPAPFSDEGIDFTYRAPFCENILYTFDAYAVNGLQGNSINIFNRSRAYFDNNEDPAGGLRMTLGGEFFRIGTSVQSGNLADQNQARRLYYTLAGADATAQINDWLRFYFEYAMRQQNSAFLVDEKEFTSGTVTQFELRLWDQPYISALVRYDTLDSLNPSFGDTAVSRFTWGFNIGLPGGSLLMINHERWDPKDADHVDVFGVRWVVSL